MVSTKGLEKWRVLKALYDNAKPQGLGWLQYDPAPMTEAAALRLVETANQSLTCMGGVARQNPPGRRCMTSTTAPERPSAQSAH